MTINQIIPDHFKAFSEKNKDFPEKVLELLHDLLITADRKALDKDAIEKLFDGITEKYATNDQILEWSKKYDEWQQRQNIP